MNIQTVTTDSGAPPVVSDGSNNINIFGGDGIVTSGQGPGSTVTVSIDVPLAVSFGGTGNISLTDGGILLGSGTGPITVTAQPTNGQLLIGSSLADPVLNTLTEGTGIDILNAAGSITISVDQTELNDVVREINVDFDTAPGTDPVVPSMGQVSIIGSTVANATNLNSPIATHSRAANALNVEIQVASAAAPSPVDAFDAGIASFDNSQFTVNTSTGFVQLAGGTGAAIQSVNVDTASGTGTDPVVPNATGQIAVTGNQVATGTTANVIRTHSTTANSITIEVQRSTTAVGANVSLNGVCHFDSSDFSVDANGFVTFTGSSGSEVSSITTDDGAPAVVPTAGNINILGGEGIDVTGQGPGSTVTVSGELATAAANVGASNIGISSYLNADFSVTAGFTELADTVVKSVASDSASATPSSHSFTIAGGTGVTTSGSGSTITINAAFEWVEVTGTSQSASVQTGYILNNASLVTLNLPGTFAVGDEIRIAGKGTGLWVVDAPVGDTIHFGVNDTSAGGTITATNRYDCLHLVGTVANSEWTVLNAVGNFTVA